MGWVGLGEFVIVMTQTQPDPLLKRNFITQPNPPTPKNRPNPAGWVESSRVGSVLVGWLHTTTIPPLSLEVYQLGYLFYPVNFYQQKIATYLV